MRKYLSRSHFSHSQFILLFTIDNSKSSCILGIVKRGWRRGTNRKAHHMRQHDAHVSARYDYLIRCIYEALGIVEGAADFTDWYACGDDLI